MPPSIVCRCDGALSSRSGIASRTSGRRVATIALALWGSVLPVVSAAQTPVPPPVTTSAEAPSVFDQGTFNSWSVITDNDVYWQQGDNEDRNYTAGFGFVFSGSFVRKAGVAKPLHGIDRLTGVARASSALDHHYYSMALVGTGFTPDTLNTPDVVRGDRPYGSVVALSVRRLQVDSSRKHQTLSSELQIGMLGLGAARFVQSQIHSYLRKRNHSETPYEPLGWHNQISHGGEPTGLYRVAYERWTVGARTANPDVLKHFQSSVGVQATAGYYTDVTATASARLGFFFTDFWEFAPALSVMTPQAAKTPERKEKAEVFLYGALRPRAVLYNALLQGQFKDSVYTVTPRRTQLEWDLGAAAHLPLCGGRGLSLAWSFYPGRTAEFVGPNPRTHTWGSFMLTVTHSPRSLK